MARRTPRIVPGDIEYVPTSTAEQLAHADALRRHGQDHPDYRAQYCAEAAEHYAAAGHDETAEELFRAALEDGGHVAGSLHSYYAEFLFTRDRPDEALSQIDAARNQRPDDPDVFAIIGETLDAHDHHHEAARWLTTGLVRYYGDLAEITADDLDHDPDCRTMAADRLRARRNAGLDPDHIDNLIAPIIENTNEP